MRSRNLLSPLSEPRRFRVNTGSYEDFSDTSSASASAGNLTMSTLRYSLSIFLNSSGVGVWRGIQIFFRRKSHPVRHLSSTRSSTTTFFEPMIFASTARILPHLKENETFYSSSLSRFGFPRITSLVCSNRSMPRKPRLVGGELHLSIKLSSNPFDVLPKAS